NTGVVALANGVNWGSQRGAAQNAESPRSKAHQPAVKQAQPLVALAVGEVAGNGGPRQAIARADFSDCSLRRDDHQPFRVAAKTKISPTIFGHDFERGLHARDTGGGTDPLPSQKFPLPIISAANPQSSIPASRQLAN